jgi:predicted RNase H-like nuclease
LIDIPIGLRGRNPEERLCDKAARVMLGAGRASSVFPAPSRYVLGCVSYTEASEKNREFTGRRLSQQSWAIVPKIREVDEYLRREPQRGKIHEMHPEICFWALNGQRPMEHNKKKAEGYEQRMILLERILPGVRKIADAALAQYPRKQLARDDILDAIVGAVTAALPGTLHRIPLKPETDERVLPMEIVYRASAFIV